MDRRLTVEWSDAGSRKSVLVLLGIFAAAAALVRAMTGHRRAEERARQD
jgi:hypothetical protein